MSSTNDTYHHLFVQAQPKSILKKSPSPKFLDGPMSFDANLPTVSPTDEVEKDGIEACKISNQNHVCILDDNQPVKKDNSFLFSLEIPLTKVIVPSDEIAAPLARALPRADSSSSLTSDEEQQQRVRSKPKKNYHRPFVATSTLSSSSDNDERNARRSMKESKPTPLRSSKHRAKDMQLDEFIRKYQHEGGIPLPTKEDHEQEQTTTTTTLPINHRQQ